MSDVPRLPPAAPADGLRGHCETLRSHAHRLRAGAAALEWRGPQADALRAEVAALADRCARAADGFALAAAQLDGVHGGVTARVTTAGRSPGRPPR
ncbi:hypothetical protein ABZW32_26030 [Streptomyces sp. NPDC004667]|uniref:hypothetical protein n=1 Tax=Streptomyces sp. NPDC004667 TaxID=3154285 RepID=UPI0033BB4181